jgi:hypothetical protein
MTAEIIGTNNQFEVKILDMYHSPQDMIRDSDLSRSTFRAFIHAYRDKDRLNRLSSIERRSEKYGVQQFAQELWTGYGALGEVIHIRVLPSLMDDIDGYFVARADLHTGIIDEPVLRGVERFSDLSGTQMILYLDDNRCEQWPAEYQPMVHCNLTTYHLTYHHGFGAGCSLLKPIEDLCSGASLDTTKGQSLAQSAIGGRTLALVHSDGTDT